MSRISEQDLRQPQKRGSVVAPLGRSKLKHKNGFSGRKGVTKSKFHRIFVRIQLA